MPQVTTSTCGQLYQIFHLSVILSLKPRFRKAIQLWDFFEPPKFVFGEKGLSGEARRDEGGRGGWMGGKYERRLVDFYKMPKRSVGFIGFIQIPPCGVFEGSGRVQSGI